MGKRNDDDLAILADRPDLHELIMTARAVLGLKSQMAAIAGEVMEMIMKTRARLEEMQGILLSRIGPRELLEVQRILEEIRAHYENKKH